MPRITAEASAPPTPCRNRPAISTSALPAVPHSKDAAVNRPSPARKTRLLPIRSPIRPASRSSPAKAIRYEFITHARPAWENPRSLWIVGNATVTTVPSRMIINCMTHNTSRAFVRPAATGRPA